MSFFFLGYTIKVCAYVIVQGASFLFSQEKSTAEKARLSNVWIDSCESSCCEIHETCWHIAHRLKCVMRYSQRNKPTKSINFYQYSSNKLASKEVFLDSKITNTTRKLKLHLNSLQPRSSLKLQGSWQSVINNLKALLYWTWVKAMKFNAW